MVLVASFSLLLEIREARRSAQPLTAGVPQGGQQPPKFLRWNFLAIVPFRLN